MARVRAVVRGRVQGVSYRMNARHEARVRGLTGWVMNQDDGSVALEASGPRERIEDLIAWCRRGPAGAQVTAVEVEWLDEAPGRSPGASGFDIRY